jgi:uncharacterized phage-associated protein
MAEVMNVAAAVQDAYGPQPLDWWKLHKLLYFCQGWSLAWTGRPLFRERIEAWRAGPVVPTVYRVQKHYPLAPPGSADALVAADRQTAHEVVRFYGRYPTNRLIELTHREPPWRGARKGVPAKETCRNEITHDLMREYFATLSSGPHHIPESVRRTIDVLLNAPEEQVDHVLEDSGVDFDAELSYLRGEGPNPWPQRSPSQH